MAVALATMAVGASAAGAKTFSNAGAITIPDVDNATPYPSQITVSGQKAPISDLNVKLNGFSHSYPDDVGVVLVAPGGQALLLMDCAGDSTDAANVNLTIDDSAAAQITNVGSLSSGTFKPTDHCPDLSSFIAPGPLTSYGNPGPGLGGTATLASSFNGTTANGVWSLFVRDFGGPDGGQLAGGWALDISPDPPKAKKCKKKNKKKCKKKKRKKKKKK
ncbi:MAG: hypothetical protein ACXWFH_10735 [Solirubrobacterales bacterium]